MNDINCTAAASVISLFMRCTPDTSSIWCYLGICIPSHPSRITSTMGQLLLVYLILQHCNKLVLATYYHTYATRYPILLPTALTLTGNTMLQYLTINWVTMRGDNERRWGDGQESFVLTVWLIQSLSPSLSSCTGLNINGGGSALSPLARPSPYFLKKSRHSVHSSAFPLSARCQSLEAVKERTRQYYVAWQWLWIMLDSWKDGRVAVDKLS